MRILRATGLAVAGLSAAQALDMRLTGLPARRAPELVLERLTGRRLDGAAAVLGGQAAQGSLAVAAASVATTATA